MSNIPSKSYSGTQWNTMDTRKIGGIRALDYSPHKTGRILDRIRQPFGFSEVCHGLIENDGKHQLKIWVIDQSLHHGDLALIAAPGQDTYDLRLMTTANLRKNWTTSPCLGPCAISGSQAQPSEASFKASSQCSPCLIAWNQGTEWKSCQSQSTSIHKGASAWIQRPTHLPQLKISVHTVPTEPTPAYALHSDNVA